MKKENLEKAKMKVEIKSTSKKKGRIIKIKLDGGSLD